MDSQAHFAVNTRLMRILGEGYRSSEAALKELVDNAWDAEATNVWIVLPEPLTSDPIVVRDNGCGMIAAEIRGEYLNIASDKRTRTGERTPKFNRAIKGRKGIGKFADLSIAGRMQLETIARGRLCTLTIDKKELPENHDDLVAVALPFSEQQVVDQVSGTTVSLSELDPRLNFPTPEKLREVLIYEYGREELFRVFVNGVSLSVEDIPGTTKQTESVLPTAGDVDLHVTVADGRRIPRRPGIILKVNGKTVGRPSLFGLDDDEEIPANLAKRVYGEIDLSGSGVEDFITADWSGILENSRAYQEVSDFVRQKIKEQLTETHKRELDLQRRRLQRQIDLRLRKLPEYRRRYAEEALNKILRRFYGESDDRIAAIADVALDAMEHDAYWAVLQHIHDLSQGDVGAFAGALEEFGILELATIGTQASRRRQFLEHLDRLIQNDSTLEKDVHKYLEKNLWVLGRKYSLMSSNVTLRRVVEGLGEKAFAGERAS